MTDFHSHILPSLDDGSKSPEMSVEMIKIGINQGVNKFIFTPHFYSDNTSYQDFIISRKKAIIELSSHCQQSEFEMPEFLVGAEVALTDKTCSLENLDKLCIEGTELLLLELPYSPFVNWAPKAIYNIMYERNITPVMAHLDRYISSRAHKPVIEEILKMDIPIQINASAFLDRKARKFIKKLIGNANMVVLGSDVHNLKTRPYEFDKAKELASKKFKTDVWTMFENNGENILDIYKKD